MTAHEIYVYRVIYNNTRHIKTIINIFISINPFNWNKKAKK